MVQAKESVRLLKPYKNGKHTHAVICNNKRIMKLDSNESTLPPSPKVTAALMQYLQSGSLNWYPDVLSEELCRALTQYTQLPTKNILTFNGSDHALETIARTFLNEGEHVLCFTPTYDHFRVYVESCSAQLVCRPEATHLNLAETLENEKIFYKIVYRVSPNNPTGTLVESQDLVNALNQNPETLFLIDEAYFEFCDQTVAPLIKKHKNLVVTRSFSKAFGLAGLRCGYILAHESLCRQINKIRVGKNINHMAQVAAVAALSDLDYMKNYVAQVTEARSFLDEGLQSLGIKTLKSNANFLLFKVAQPEQVLRTLESFDILIRDRSELSEIQGFLRVTIGDLFTMKRFWKVFQNFPQDWLVNTELQTKKSSAEDKSPL